MIASSLKFVFVGPVRHGRVPWAGLQMCNNAKNLVIDLPGQGALTLCLDFGVRFRLYEVYGNENLTLVPHQKTWNSLDKVSSTSRIGNELQGHFIATFTADCMKESLPQM